VEVQAGAGGMLKPDTADNRDVGLPNEPGAEAGGLSSQGFRVAGKGYSDQASADAAATAANAPDAVAQRQSDAYRRIGKPMEAAQLENATLQGKAAKFTLEKGQQEWLDQKFDKQLSTIGSPQDLVSVISGSSLVGGRKVSIVTGADGKGQLVAMSDDGMQTKIGKEFDVKNFDAVKAMTQFSQSMTPGQKISALQQFAQFEESKRQFEVNKDLQREQIGISRGHLGIAQQGLKLQKDKFEADLKNDPTHNLPPAVKLTVGGIDKTLAGIESAMTKAQAEGQWDPKSEGGRELLARQAKLINDRNKVLKPYLGGGAAVSDDPLGLRTAPPAAAVPSSGGTGAPKPAGVASGGLPKPAPVAAPAVDRIGEQPIGPLTPMADIMAAAEAGNPRAIEYLRRRQQAEIDNATAPRTSAEMLR
jgi:hypothetical protein